MQFNQISGEFVGLARGSAVADTDEFDFVLGSELGKDGDGRIPLVLWRMRIDRGMLQQLAGGPSSGGSRTPSGGWNDLLTGPARADMGPKATR